jgi:NAD(P)-dependent dehydrogenase (short-subunit alcohol dehydrogenase family)
MNVKELLSLKNKIILVTGGSRKYGRCIVEGLAEADGTVIVTSRDIELARETAASFQKQGLDVHPMTVDQADHDSVMALKKQILAEFGGLDVFINNAVSRPMTGYNAPISQFEESMKVNATGAMDLIREMTDVIAMGGGGSVINISSMFGMFGPDLSNYEGTNMGDLAPDYFFHNAGLINLNKFMAQMNAGKNIRFNSISPGGIFSNQPQAFIDNYCKKVPLRRMANNDDIKGIVVLLSSEAGSYINGENILMDGGLNA